MKTKSRPTKKERLVKGLLIIFSFIFLLIFSEGIYQFRNNADFEYLVYLNLVRLSAKTSSVHYTFKFLGKAAEVKIKKNSNEYLEVIPSNYVINIDSSKEIAGFNKSMLDYVIKLDYQSLSQSDSNDLAKVFYYLGLIAYQDGQYDHVIPFWESSIYLAPWWSHFHVELANLYLFQGNKSASEDILKKCYSLDNPKRHCQMYFDNDFDTNKPREIGFLEKYIGEEI